MNLIINHNTIIFQTTRSLNIVTVSIGEVSFKEASLKIWAQLMGGCCIFRYVQLYWWFELAETHEGRAFEDCKADLQVR